MSARPLELGECGGSREKSHHRGRGAEDPHQGPGRGDRGARGGRAARITDKAQADADTLLANAQDTVDASVAKRDRQMGREIGRA